MILVWGAVLGMLLGWLAQGRLRNLEHLHLRRGWLVGLALLIQVIIFPLGHAKPLITWGTVPLHLLSYGLLVLFLLFNLRHWPLVMMGLGLAANLIVIAANGGYMPADPVALARAGMEGPAATLVEEGRVGNVVEMGENTRLNLLGDWLYLPKWFPLAAAFSLGDVVIALGLASLFPYAMRKAEDQDIKAKTTFATENAEGTGDYEDAQNSER